MKGEIVEVYVWICPTLEEEKKESGSIYNEWIEWV